MLGVDAATSMQCRFREQKKPDVLKNALVASSKNIRLFSGFVPWLTQYVLYFKLIRGSMDCRGWGA
jgi:hypothetical protein